MSGFDDLLDPYFSPPANQSAEPHVVGTSLVVPITVLDGNGTAINFSAGFTALLTPYVSAKTPLSPFTEILAAGRQIVLGVGQVTVKATPAASRALFSGYEGLVATTTLLVTRTSDGATVPLWRNCYFPLRPRHNA